MGQYFSSEPNYQEEEDLIMDNHNDEDFYLDFITHLLIKYKRLKQQMKIDDEPLIDERIF